MNNVFVYFQPNLKALRYNFKHLQQNVNLYITLFNGLIYYLITAIEKS